MANLLRRHQQQDPPATERHTYPGGMADDPMADFLAGLEPEVRATAELIATAVRASANLSCAVKWRQLTFAVDGDYDHWICAVSATKRSAALIMHFGSLLDHDRFDPSEAKYTRRITYRTPAEVDVGAIRDIVGQAVDTLPQFRRATSRS